MSTISSSSGADQSTVGIQLVAVPPESVKPCMPVAVLARLELGQDGVDDAGWGELLADLAESFRVNDIESPAVISRSHRVMTQLASLELLPGAAEQGDTRMNDKWTSRRVLISLHLDSRTKECVLKHPGSYRVNFGVDAVSRVVSIRVSAPTQSEVGIARELESVEFSLFLQDPTNQQYSTRARLQAVEAMLETETSYSNLLALALGLAESDRRVDETGNPLPVTDQIERWKKAYGLITDHVGQSISLPLEAKALLAGSFLAEWLADIESDSTKKAQYLSRRDTLLQMVLDSPLSFQIADRAREQRTKIIAGK